MTTEAAEPAGTAAIRRDRLTTHDRDEATEIARRRYADHEPTFSGPREDFVLDVGCVEVATTWGPLAIDRVRESARVSAATEPTPELVLGVERSGRMRLTCGRDVTGPGPLLCPSWAPFRLDCEDIDVTLAVVDQDGVRRIGAELSGLDPSAVGFVEMSTISPDHARYVERTLDHVCRDLLANDEVIAAPLARAQAFRHLATALLVGFPNTTHVAEAPRDGLAGPATVRRAVEFIEGHAAHAIGLADIADAARLGVRGLQAAFRRHLGCTPLEYLRRARLDGAHRELRAGDPTRGATVSAIAARWGFTHPGRFSAEYRRRYGCPPSETLRD